jgi:hypothetical protein
VVLAGRRKLQRFAVGARRLHAAQAFDESTGGALSAHTQRASDVLHATLAHTTSLHRRRAVWRRLGAYSEPL